MIESVTLPTEQATEAWASVLAQQVAPGGILFLQGDLGAGKTTFARGFLRGLGFQGLVKSPTFTLVEEYPFTWGFVYHFDLYRLTDPKECEPIGIQEYFAGNTIVLIEWPERGAFMLPQPDWVLNFKMPSQGRTVHLQAITQRGQHWLMQVRQAGSR